MHSTISKILLLHLPLLPPIFILQAYLTKLRISIIYFSFQIFVQAYPEYILPEFRISDLNLINNFENEFNIFFGGVRSLDLNGCRLGDDHDVIRLDQCFSTFFFVRDPCDKLRDTRLESSSPGSLTFSISLTKKSIRLSGNIK